MDQTNSEAKNEFDPEEIDKLIAEEDPSFAGELDALAKESELGGDDLAGLSADADYEMEAEPEGERSEESESSLPPIARLRAAIGKKWSRLRDRLRLSGTAFRNRLAYLMQKTKAFLIHGVPERIGYFRSQSKAIVAGTLRFYRKFAGLSVFQKSALFGSIALAVSAIFFLSLTLREQWLTRFVPDLPTSLLSSGEIIGKVRSKEDLINFERAFPDKEYQVRLPKIIVNLRTDRRSGAVPMGAFEFYLGLDAQDTAVEVTDREKEVIDRVQRAVETMTYTEVMSANGKSIMKSRIRDSLNKMLNRGRVTGVYISTMVTNH